MTLRRVLCCFVATWMILAGRAADGVVPEPADPPPATAATAPGAQPATDRQASPPDTPLDLPITAYPAEPHGTVMAVIYSGDGGWRDLDKQIGIVLSKRGVPVVGVDSLRYFWHRKSPDRIARDLARIIRFYSARWSTPSVILIGYSFGADILPFAVNRLPEDVRAAVVQISLLGVESTALFEIHVANWVVKVRGDAAVMPELLRLNLDRVQCVYGADEPDTLCRSPELRGAEIIGTTGGHHFDGDYRALAQKIIDGFQRRMSVPAPGARAALRR